MDNCSNNFDIKLNSYYKGDDFGSFGGKGIIINVVNIPDNITITKAELRVGPIVEIYDQQPIFPIEWTPDKETTELLDYANECYLAVYDDEGRKRTCIGHFTFIVKDKVV